MPPSSVEFGYRHPETGDICEPNVKQRLAHDTPADVTFFGGAVGGGKSEWISVDAPKDCIIYPRSNVAIFRRTLGEIEEHLLGRWFELHEALLNPPHANEPLVKFNAQKMKAVYWNRSTLWFRSCQYEKDVYKYQGFQLRSLNVDEVTHFTEFILRYLFTRVRKVTGGRKRIRLSGNPGNVGHGVMKRWFIRPVAAELGNRPPPKPFEVWRPKSLNPKVPDEHVLSRVFIPSFFSDNWALQLQDPLYLEQNVYPLGGEKARQLAEGDWDANDSMILGSDWAENHVVSSTDGVLLAQGFQVGQLIPWHVIPDPLWRPNGTAKVWGSVDYGFGAPWAFHLHCGLIGGHTRTWWERYATRKRDRVQAELIREDILRFEKDGIPKPDYIVCDPAMWNSRAETGLSQSIAEVYQSVLGPIGVRIRPGAAGRGARVSRPQRWLDALAIAPDGLPWHSFTTACPEAIRTCPEVPWDPDDPEVEDDDAEQHCYEGIGRYFESRPHAPRVKAKDPYAHLDPASRAEWTQLDASLAAQKQKAWASTFTQP